MNESEHLVFQAVHGLQRALQGDYRDVVNMKESSRQRLEALREAAIKVNSASCTPRLFASASRQRQRMNVIVMCGMLQCCFIIPLLTYTIISFGSPKRSPQKCLLN